MSLLLQTYLRISAVVLFYWIISISMVFVNKFILSDKQIHLDAPISVTFFQSLCAFIFSICVSEYNIKRQHPLLQLIQFPHIRFSFKLVKDALPLSVTFVLMIVFNNLCLQNVQIAFYFVGRSLSTVFNVIFTYFLLGEKTSIPALISCAVIVFGFFFGCDQEKLSGNLTYLGIFYGLAASIFVSLNSIFAKRVLAKFDQNVWLVNFYNNLIGIFMFVPLIIWSGELETIANFEYLGAKLFWSMLLLSAIFGFLIQFASVLQIKLTSPLTHNISGTVKACIQTVLAMIIYNQHKSFIWWLSNGLVIGGSMAYTRVRQIEMIKKSQEISKTEKTEDEKPLITVKSI